MSSKSQLPTLLTLNKTLDTMERRYKTRHITHTVRTEANSFLRLASTRKMHGASLSIFDDDDERELNRRAKYISIEVS
jgi:hypothetical protein